MEELVVRSSPKTKTKGAKRPRALDTSPKGKRRKNKLDTPVTHTPPSDSSFAFHIRDGHGWACSIKSLGISHTEGNLRIDRDSISFTRANDSVTLLNIVTIDTKQVLLKADFDSVPNGFHFGFKFAELAQTTTNSVEKHDSLMMYFKENIEDGMFFEQINPITMETSRSTVTFTDVFEPVYKTFTVGTPGTPNIKLRVFNFCKDCAQLPSAKAHSVTMACGPAGMAIVGRSATGDPIKTKFFAADGFAPDTANTDATIAHAIVSVTIPIRTFKALVNIRGSALAKGIVEISYEKGGPILIHAPYLNVGRQRFYLRDKKTKLTN